MSDATGARSDQIRTQPGRLAAAAFAALWAASVCFHLGSYGIWNDSLWAGLAAVWLLANPSSTPRLLLLAAAVAADVWAHLPEIPNHWLVHGGVAAAALLAYGCVASERRTFDVDAARVYAAFAPAVRVSVLVLYFYVVLHKLNYDYLASPLSCGAEFYRAQRQVFGFLPSGYGFEMASAYVTLLVEAAIPLLLVFTRTRAWGVLIGVIFHVFIAFNPKSGFYNFSAFLFALFVLFVPEASLDRVWSELWSWRARIPARLYRFARWKLLVAMGGGIGAVSALVYASRAFGYRATFLALWIPYSALAAWLALRLVRVAGVGGEPEPLPLRPAHALLWIVPAIMVLNGATPYLGLKTENSFSMFSNLRTEGGVSNHLFFPAAQAFDLQHDLVEIVDASLPPLRRVHDHAELLPYFELQRLLARKPRASVRYRRGRDDNARAAAGEQSAVGNAPAYFYRKVFRFRPVQRAGEQPCVH